MNAWFDSLPEILTALRIQVKYLNRFNIPTSPMFVEDYTFCDNIIDDENYGIAEMETTKSRVRSMIDWINSWYSVTSKTVAIVEHFDQDTGEVDFYKLEVFSRKIHD